MRDLQYQLKNLCDRNKDGSFSTRARRQWELSLIAEQLWQYGYRDLGVQGLRGRHIARLLTLWKEQGLASGTVKNRMSALRWWAQKIGKGRMIPRSNDQLSIPKREGVSATSKAVTLTPEQRHAITDQYVRCSVDLQRVFGLRREESIKIWPEWADRGDHLVLSDTWCKGGRSRVLPIHTHEQRTVLNHAKQVAGSGSLIPPASTYKTQLEVYKYQLQKIGAYRMHGLRHAYAQRRYEELSGQKAPHAGGPDTLTKEERQADHRARMEVSRELGHNRKAITSAYLGAVQAAKKK